MPTVSASALLFHDTVAQATVKHNVDVSAEVQHDTEFTYTFENFFHPFVGQLVERLNLKSLDGLLDPNFLGGLKAEFFDTFYTSLTELVKVNHFPKEIDLRVGGPYANYNWELFYHIPLTIAVHLSKNQRFDEAQRWFHFIFDPTANDTSVPVPTRFWRFLAFRKPGELKQIDEQLAILSKPTGECTPAELDLKNHILEGYEAIKDDPFQPHKVARTRQLAYQYSVVMKYLDNLIAWGDSLFQQDTIESINEATQLYVLAANLLGNRPQRIPQAGSVRPKTFAELKKQGLDPFGNALVELEGKFPLDLGLPHGKDKDPDAPAPLFGIGRALYFCIPRNEKLLGYWDTVADRLFKIRHCMNIEGMVRQLALYDPPLDPGMLVRAAAAGIGVGALISGMNQPASPVRALLLIQKSLELCGEVRSLGAALLSAIEKGDGERMTLLRQGHEAKIQEMQQEVRYLQWASAQEVTKSLLASRAAPLERLHFYQRLFGLPDDPNAVDTTPISFDGLSLTEANFAEAYHALVEKFDKPVATQAFPQLSLTEDGRARMHLTTKEDDEFSHLKAARDTGIAATICNALAAGFTYVPDAKANLHFWGIGGTVDLKAGKALVASAKIAGDVLGIISTWENQQAGMAAKTASYERRADEWLLQHNLAAQELMQIGRQVLSSLIAEQVAFHEYQLIKKQIEQAQEVERFLREKFSNEALYAWMQGEISRLYYEYYRFAAATACKTERAVKHELMRPEIDAQNFVKFNYWDGGRRGLLSGEALYLDVKRMELAYHENNKREYELTKHVSLRQLQPAALLALKATGSCQVSVPEWLFDLDTPGHYLRRIKNVSLTIPAVSGPYTGVSCTLTLLKSALRKSPIVGEGFARQGSEDERFIDYFSATQSIVTSNGQNDSGLFDTNLRDERFLPFEGAGAESNWKLQLPEKFRQFDYRTISDIVLHVRYTAREGGAALRAAAVERLAQLADEASQAGSNGLGALFSLRNDFPSEWAAFVNGNAAFSAALDKRHFPYFVQDRPIVITGFELYRLLGASQVRHRAAGDGAALSAATATLDERGEFTFSSASEPLGPNQVLARVSDADVWLIVKYTF
jgi:hypothetical protein